MTFSIAADCSEDDYFGFLVGLNLSVFIGFLLAYKLSSAMLIHIYDCVYSISVRIAQVLFCASGIIRNLAAVQSKAF